MINTSANPPQMFTKLDADHKLPEQGINVGSCIVGICSCPDYFAVGCIDDSVRVWVNKWEEFNRTPVIQYSDLISGVTDVGFSKKSTHFASLSIDSSIKIWDLDTRAMKTIQVPMFSAFKLIFTSDSLITCGDVGRILIYDIFSRENTKKMEAGDHFLTAINKNSTQKRLIVGNANGDVYIVNLEAKEDHIHLKPHFKMIRSLTYSKDQKSILTGSDDSTISLTDLAEGKVVLKFQGHKEKVNCVKNHFDNGNLFFSCSSDKTVKTWDLRVRKSVRSIESAHSLLSLEPLDKRLLLGGESGILHILNID